jgi:hypothetical protein
VQKSDEILINLLKYFYISKILNLDSIDLMIPEINYAENKKRADLLIVKNNNLIAIEIKSDEDSLQKLPEQLNYYKKNFHQTYILTTEKHYTKVYNMIKNTKIGLLLQKKSKDIEIYKKAETYTQLNKFFLISLINKNNHKNIIFENLSMSKLLQLVIENLHIKYKQKFDNFKQEIKQFEDFFTSNLDHILDIYKLTYKKHKHFKYL